MINGLRLSEIHEVSLNHLNHYRRITSVESSDFSRLSHLDTSFVKIVQNRKINHVNLLPFSNAGKSFNKTVTITLLRTQHRPPENQYPLL